MTLKIEKTLKGKFYSTVNGRRLTNTNHTRRWEALSTARKIIAHYGEKKILEMLAA